jgi:hypothetical protein
MALIYFSLAMLVFLIYNLPENKKRFLENKMRFTTAVSAGVVFSLMFNCLFFESLYGKAPRAADMFLMSIPFAVSTASVVSFSKRIISTLRAGYFFPVFLVLFSTFLVVGIYTRIY